MILSKTAKNRTGIILIMALVVMATLATILSVVTMQIVAERRHLHLRERQLQAQWLARAGVELAAARLLENPAGFVDEKEDLLPDSKIKIVADKSGQDTYLVTVDVELGPPEEKIVANTASRRFRRTESEGAIRLQGFR